MKSAWLSVIGHTMRYTTRSFEKAASPFGFSRNAARYALAASLTGAPDCCFAIALSRAAALSISQSAVQKQ